MNAPDGTERDVCESCGEQLPWRSDETIHPSCRELLPVCAKCELAVLPGDDHDGDNGTKWHAACCEICEAEAAVEASAAAISGLGLVSKDQT